MVLLAQYGALEQEAIETGTLLSDAVPRGDMAMLSFDIDGIWKFPTGQGYNRDGSNINPGWIVDRLAGDINSRGGTVIH
jgi:hypothetical protein